MSNSEEERVIKRILVALDASTDSLAALDAAAKLAARLEAELVGLFVEDINLIRMAKLPFTREHRFSQVWSVDHEEMERALRLQASQARRALSQAAEPRSVRWSFKVVRGQVTPEVLAAALEADLLTLGKASRLLSRRNRLGSTARAAAQQAPHSVFLTTNLAEENRPILVTYDRTSEARQSLHVATHLAQANQLPLTIFVLIENREDTQITIQSAEDWLANHSPTPQKVKYIPLLHPNLQALIDVVRLEGAGTLVLGGTHALLQADTIQKLLDELDCPILVVR